MTVKRLLLQMRFWLYLGRGDKRAAYAKKKGLFSEIGQGVKLPATVPLYPQMVKVHNNVIMHRSVKMVTHDFVNRFLNRVSDSYRFQHGEMLTPIEIMDNVYIGMNVVIFGNVRIGPNAVIQAGSVVINDVPPNSVVAGVPAKVVGKFDMLMKTRILMDKVTKYSFQRSGQERINTDAVEAAWDAFEKKKNRLVCKGTEPT